MLCDKFALLYCDGYGNYMLSHQNFYDYFIREYNIKNTKLSALKIKLALPYMAAVCLVIVLFTFAFIKMAAQITVSYPRTLQQKYITENAMTAAAESLGRLGVLIKNDTAVLDSYTEGYKEFINVYTRNRSVNNTLVSNELYTEDKSRQFVPPGSPVPLGILSDLLNSTKDYNTWSCIMFENLNTVLSDESKYPQKDRLDIIALYKQYLKSYTNLCYIKMELVILPLNSEGRKPVLDALPYIAVFGDEFTSHPFVNNKAELESALKTENVRLQDISGKLKSYGMKGE
jgi:hypothetical protein